MISARKSEWNRERKKNKKDFVFHVAIFLKKRLTLKGKYNIISQCDVVRKYLAKSPGIVFSYKFYL